MVLNARAGPHRRGVNTRSKLPVTYYPLGFTLPQELNEWVELHPQGIYPLLFQCVWTTLDAFGRDPKRLNGCLGMTAVLHTWGQLWAGMCICTA
jgi:hypothetical protein